MELMSETKFDLLITDHAMPGMNGVQLAGAVRQMRAGHPVILVTGFAAGGMGGTKIRRGRSRHAQASSAARSAAGTGLRDGHVRWARELLRSFLMLRAAFPNFLRTPARRLPWLLAGFWLECGLCGDGSVDVVRQSAGGRSGGSCALAGGEHARAECRGADAGFVRASEVPVHGGQPGGTRAHDFQSRRPSPMTPPSPAELQRVPAALTEELELQTA